MLISAIVVTYNSANVIGPCLRSLDAALRGYAGEMIVVDNASQDGTCDVVAERAPEALLVGKRRNVGFAGGVNTGLRRARGHFVLLLNPDATVSTECVDRLLAALNDDERAGVAAPRLVSAEGCLQASCRRFPTVRGMLVHRLSLLGYVLGRSAVTEYLNPRARCGAGSQPVDWVIGACMLIRRAAIECVGLFDEAFFLYCEDVDWCYRARRAGWHCVYVPGAVCEHAYRRDSARGVNLRLVWHAQSAVRYFQKHGLRL